jgi:phosphatidylglycerophosphatase C
MVGDAGEPSDVSDARDVRDVRDEPVHAAAEHGPTPELALEHVLARVFEALERERAFAPSPMLAFDADGTLWRGDVGFDALFELFERGVRAEAREALAREAALHGVAVGHGDDATTLAKKLTDAYFAGAYDETAAFAMMSWVFAGHDEGELEAFSRALFEEKGLAARLHPWVREVLAFAAAREISTLIVSASPRFLIEAAARALALPVTSAHGMVVARDAAGRLEPRLAEPPTTGQGKLEALRRAHPGATLLGAFGDGGWDAPMVLAARVRVAVGHGSGLAKRQPPIEGLFVLPASDHLAPLAPPAPPVAP